MRLAVLADVHGNLPALEAVLERVEAAAVDEVVVAGDLVGYGPWPNECVQRIAALEAIVVAGNHDLIVLGRLSDDRCWEVARRTQRWTRRRLDASARTYLESLPLRADLRNGVTVAHGSLDDPEVYVRTAAGADAQLRQLDAPAALLVLGHTHEPWLRGQAAGTLLRGRPGRGRLAPGERHLLNPGSVGRSCARAADARFAVVDLAAGTVDLRATPYDVEACRAALRRAGLPAVAVHAPPPPLHRRARSSARQLARRLRPAFSTAPHDEPAPRGRQPTT